jgi:outer membrane biosynthesis protein TonB
MGAPGAGMKAAEQSSAETLLTAFRTIDASERQKHADVLNYWLSIRGDKEFPPLHDLDPLKISEAGPCSVLLELISGGHDAEIRHLGEGLRAEGWPEQIMDAANPSILASIAKKLPIVAISRDFLAFEDEYSAADGATRCWVTLLPLSGGGAWVDYVYALVSFETVLAKGAKTAEKPAKRAEAPAAEVEEPAKALPAEPEAADTPPEEAEQPVEAVAVEPEPVEDEPVEAAQVSAEPEPAEPDPAPAAKAPGFAKLFDGLAGLTGFYAQGVKVEPVIPAEQPADEPVADEPVADEPAPDEPVPDELSAESKAEQPAEGRPAAEPAPTKQSAAEQPAEEKAEEPTPASEGSLQSKLTQVRAKADEARMAKLRANAALYEGLGAAYDFALDAEDTPEEYLRLVEAKGLKIQLRSPMTPVVKLAFEGLCDDSAIAQLEAVLAWALEEDLPRGSLAERIEAAGGIARVLSGEARAA